MAAFIRRECSRKNTGFNDADGIRPDYAVFDAAIEQAKKTFLAPSIDAGRFANVDWKLAPKMEVGS